MEAVNRGEWVRPWLPCCIRRDSSSISRYRATASSCARRVHTRCAASSPYCARQLSQLHKPISANQKRSNTALPRYVESLLHSLGNYTRRAIFPEMCKINQSSVDVHDKHMGQLWLDWFIGFVPPSLFLRGRGSSGSTSRDKTEKSWWLLVELDFHFSIINNCRKRNESEISAVFGTLCAHAETINIELPAFFWTIKVQPRSQMKNFCSRNILKLKKEQNFITNFQIENITSKLQPWELICAVF